jgi:hypothetical protein
MFDNTRVDIIINAQGTVNDDGIYVLGEEEIPSFFFADVQPYSSELLYRDYGFQENVTKRMFCDPNNSIKVGSILSINEERYKIKKIIPWDYWDVMLDNE